MVVASSVCYTGIEYFLVYEVPQFRSEHLPGSIRQEVPVTYTVK